MSRKSKAETFPDTECRWRIMQAEGLDGLETALNECERSGYSVHDWERLDDGDDGYGKPPRFMLWASHEPDMPDEEPEDETDDTR